MTQTFLKRYSGLVIAFLTLSVSPMALACQIIEPIKRKERLRQMDTAQDGGTDDVDNCRVVANPSQLNG